VNAVDGPGVGLVVLGYWEGEDVGVAVGSLEGFTDGLRVGSVVGQLVRGGLEGEDVGVAVGLCVGAGVVCGRKRISRSA